MKRKFSLSGVLFPLMLLGVGAYFVFMAVQGNYGLFRRVHVTANIVALERDLAIVQAETARMENLTRRLSDDFLDLDLLDERVRAMLGYVHADDVVLP